MEYGLLPAEAALAFLAILMLVYYRKNQTETAKSRVYKRFLIASFTYTIILFIAILIKKYIGGGIITTVIWRAAIAMMIIAWSNYFLYGYVTVYNMKETSLRKITKSSAETMLLAILKGVGVIIMLLPFQWDFIDYGVLQDSTFHTKISSLLMLIITVIISIAYILRMKVYDDTISKEYKFANGFALLSSILVWVIHLFVYDISYVPIMFAFVAYIMYFLVENPDIILLNEIQAIEKEKQNNNEVNKGFLTNLNQDTTLSVNKMLEICNELETTESYDFQATKNKIKEMNDLGNQVLEELNGVFESSQIKTIQTNVDDRRYNTKELVQNITNIAQEKLTGKKVKLIINVDSNISSKFYGDYEKIFNSLTNVISTSAMNTKIGRLTISLSSTKNNNVETLLFKIIDTGEGLKPEEQEKIFDENADAYHGMTVAKKQIEIMGGKIWFESRYKLGTKFFIQINQKIADTTPLGDLADLNQEVNIDLSNVDRSKYKILIVDDCVSNTRLTKKLLKDRGFQVDVIDSGQECIRRIKAEEQIDGIFMDIMMSEMNGIETLEVLKQLEGYTLPPVIALTANALAGMREKYLSAGFDEYIAKPVDIKELDKVLNKYFNK